MANDPVGGIQPRGGRLVPLRTLAEVDAALKLEDGLVVVLAPMDAHTALKRINALLCSSKPSPPQLTHLRRIARFSELPTHVSETLSTGIPDAVLDQCPPSTPEGTPLPLALFAGLSASFPDGLSSALGNAAYIIHTIPVPSHAPADRASAEEWTREYWPTAWRNSNPYGPQPVQWEREGRLVESHADSFVGLAHALGRDLQQSGKGAGMGAVLVESSTNKVVAGAGDARWAPPFAKSEGGSGNVLAHAAMRAIALVGKRRQRLDRQVDAGSELKPVEDLSASTIFHDVPRTERERGLNDASELKPGGYLATGLDIYLSHEPCTMCAMALLHSRIGHVIFARRMPGTGGLVVERSSAGESIGEGLWWRPELNWKTLAWEFVEDGESEDTPKNRLVESIHA